MGQHVQPRVLQRAHDARRHLGAGLLEARVHGRHHDVELAQLLVGEVEGAVGEDVALGAGQDADREARLQGADGRALGTQLVDAEAAGDGERARVIRHDDVLVAARLGRLHQALQRVMAVRPVGVGVQVAAQGGDGDQRR